MRKVVSKAKYASNLKGELKKKRKKGMKGEKGVPIVIYTKRM